MSENEKIESENATCPCCEQSSHVAIRMSATALETYGSTAGLYTKQAQILGIGIKEGQRLNLSLDVALRDADELFLAALVADLRRVLPDLIEERARAAYDRIFPGALTEQ